MSKGRPSRKPRETHTRRKVLEENAAEPVGTLGQENHGVGDADDRVDHADQLAQVAPRGNVSVPDGRGHGHGEVERLQEGPVAHGDA